jgi:EAL domain-containing protein (putative c-di-GMP-specific phosphodiesterase class I)
VIRCVVALARELDIAVTAEGVETIHLYKTVKALGCDIVQGFLFGRPVEHIDFSQQIDDNGESLLAWQPQDSGSQ